MQCRLHQLSTAFNFFILGVIAKTRIIPCPHEILHEQLFDVQNFLKIPYLMLFNKILANRPNWKRSKARRQISNNYL